ncbi:MAG: transposase, partial [Acetobacteraceae bacterium]|nr:transposase [Acetobacteraceae bacterium]
MWKAEHRRACDRRGLRYPSDLTDAEWAPAQPVDPLYGSTRPAKRGGRPRTVDVREVLNAISYVLSTGCQWTALPKDLPPRSTVWDCLDRWDRNGTPGRIHHALYVGARERAGREASPALAIVDAQRRPLRNALLMAAVADSLGQARRRRRRRWASGGS